MGTTEYFVKLQRLIEKTGSGEYLGCLKQERTRNAICDAFFAPPIATAHVVKLYSPSPNKRKQRRAQITRLNNF